MKKCIALLLIISTLASITLTYADNLGKGQDVYDDYKKCVSGYELIFDMFTDKDLVYRDFFKAVDGPYSSDKEDDPNGYSWVMFVLYENVLQLSGKSRYGQSKNTLWYDMDSISQLLICYALCTEWDYVNQYNDLAICIASEKGDYSYIVSKEQAQQYAAMIDEWFGSDE